MADSMDITIVCPTFNRGPQIAKTIETVQAQTEEVWKMIVVSDASTDDTDAVVGDMAAGDARLSLLRTPRNFGGPSRPTNLALADVDTPWVAYIDHDDLWHPDHLETLRVAIETGADMVSTLSTHIDGDGTVLIPARPISGFWHPLLQLISPMFHNSSVAHKTDLIHRAGGWNEHGSGLEDWDLWLRFADQGAKVQAVAKNTVTVVRDRGTLLQSLRLEGFFPVAGFEKPLEARRHLRQLYHPDVGARIVEAAVMDVQLLMNRMEERSELVHPIGWSEGLEAAMNWDDHETAPELQNPQIPEIRVIDGRHVIGWPIATMSLEHEQRIVNFGPELFPVSYDYLEEILPPESLLYLGGGNG